MPQWFPVSPQTLYLGTVLLVLIVSSALGVILPAAFQGDKPHLYEKVINETLANHQVVYIPFYVTLLSVGKFSDDEDWIRNLILVAILMTLIFAVIAYIKVRRQDKLLTKHHVCVSDDCDQSFDRKTKIALYRTNVILAVISIVMAILFLTLPVFSRKKGPTDVKATPAEGQSSN